MNSFVVAGVYLLGILQSLQMWLSQSEARTGAICFIMNSDLDAAAMSVVQIETSRSATAWATGCVWVAHLWPELLCPARHSIHLKPITSLLLWSPFRKWQWSLWWRQRESRTGPEVWSSLRLSLAAPYTLSPTLLLSQLAAAAAIDIIAVLTTERWKVLTDDFSVWRNEIY